MIHFRWATRHTPPELMSYICDNYIAAQFFLDTPFHDDDFQSRQTQNTYCDWVSLRNVTLTHSRMYEHIASVVVISANTLSEQGIAQTRTNLSMELADNGPAQRCATDKGSSRAEATTYSFGWSTLNKHIS